MIKIRNKRNLAIALTVSVLLIVVGVIIYLMSVNTPQRTINEVLEARDDNVVTQEELSMYFTDNYSSREKRERSKINTSQYTLSRPVDTEMGKEVILRIRVLNRDQSGMVDRDAAKFYLKRTGLFPFSFAYKIDDIKEIDPNLTSTFSDILADKDLVEKNLGDTIDLGTNKVTLSDFELKEETGEDEYSTFFYNSVMIEDIDNRDLGNVHISIGVNSSDDEICTYLKEPMSEISGSKSELKVFTEEEDCGYGYILLEGSFNNNYKVNIN